MGKPDADAILRRIPPQDLQAEQSVLGAILIDNSATDIAAELLQPEDFYRDSHREIFSAMLELNRQHSPIDAIILKDLLRSSGKLESIGGPGYVAELAAFVPTAANVEYYARIVRRKAVLRAMITVTTEAASRAYEGSPDPEFGAETLAVLAYEIEQLREKYTDKPERTKAESLAQACLQQLQGAKGMLTGIPNFDKDFVGFKPGDLTTLAGRTSKGKTQLAVNIAYNVAAQGCGVAYFSLEMETDQLWPRFTALIADTMMPDDIDNARKVLLDLPLELRFKPGLRPSQFQRECHKIQRQMPIKLAIIDYFGLMRGDQKERDRWREMSEIVQVLKQTAGEMGFALLLLSQINREGDDDKPPRLSQLRETGTLEEHSSNVMFIWQPPMEKKAFSTYGGDGMVELIMAKQRNGPAPYTVSLLFNKSAGRFAPA